MSPRKAPTNCSTCSVRLTDDNCHRRLESMSFRSRCNACRQADRRARDDVREQEARLFIDRDICDICHRPETATRNGVVRLLNKDHNHSTGEWRGLLCSRCNTAIGMFSDNVHLMQSAINYLKNPPGLVVLGKERGTVAGEVAA